MKMHVKRYYNGFSSSYISLLPLVSLLFLQAIVAMAAYDLGTDKQALLDFANTLHNVPRGRLGWTSTGAEAADPTCTSWVGVTCSSDRSRVVELRLPGFGLRGTISGNTTLGRLDTLEKLDLRNNSLFGVIPPSLHFPRLRHLNLSGNGFRGPIPPSLRGFPPSSFGGNPLLCGPPLTHRQCRGGPPPLDLDPSAAGSLGRRSLKRGGSSGSKGKSKKTKVVVIYVFGSIGIFFLGFVCGILITVLWHHNHAYA